MNPCNPTHPKKLPQRSDRQLVSHSAFVAKESWRMFEIMAEFVEATERLAGIPPAVSVFAKSSKRCGLLRIERVWVPPPSSLNIWK